MRLLACVLAPVGAVALAACLFPNLDDLAAKPDAASPDANGTDGAARCDPTKPFSTPVPIPGVSLNTTAIEVSPRFSADELTLVFSRQTTTSFDLFIATRANRNDPFGAPALIDNVNSPSGEFDPFLLSDNLTLYFSTDRPDGKSQRMYVSTRPTPTAPFGTPTEVTTLDAVTQFAGQPYFLPDDTTMFFANVETGPIYTSTSTSSGFVTPSAVPGLPSTGYTNPTPASDALTMFLAKLATNDSIYVATRASTAAPFGAPTLVSEIYTGTSDDSPFWLSLDGCLLVLASDRKSHGDYDMYQAQRGL